MKRFCLFTCSVYIILDYICLHHIGIGSSSIHLVFSSSHNSCILSFIFSFSLSDCVFVLCLSLVALSVFVVFLSLSLFPCSTASLLPSSVVFVIVVHCLQ